MKIEFGDIKVEFPYEEYLKRHITDKNPFEAMFSKANFEEFTKFMAKCAKMSKPDKGDAE